MEKIAYFDGEDSLLWPRRELTLVEKIAYCLFLISVDGYLFH